MSPEESIKFKATEDVIPTEESAKEVIPEHEENHAGAPEENCGEENAQPNQSHQPAHPRVANEVQIDKILDDINAPGPLTRSKASICLTFLGTLLLSLSQSPPKLMRHFWSLSGCRIKSRSRGGGD